MIFIVELFFELLLIYKVWNEEDRTNLFIWFMTACIMLFPQFKIGVGIPDCSWMFPIVGLARFAFKDKNLIETWKAFPLKYIYAVLLIFHFVQPIFVSFQPLGLTYFYVIQYTMKTYLYVFLGFCIAPNYNELKEKKQWILACIITLFVIAVISRLTSNNFISSSLNSNSIWTAVREGSERGFRVTGPVASPNAFGFINVLMVLFIYEIEEKIYVKFLLILAVLCNLVFCATRAPLMGFFAVSGIYLLSVSKVKLVRIIVLSSMSFILIFNIIGSNKAFNNYVNNFTDLILTGGENTKGSSADLRLGQLEVSLDYAEDNPIWGNGNMYASYLMSNRNNAAYDNELYGAEGYLFFILIDYGYIYLGIVLVYFCYLLYLFYKYRLRNTRGGMLGIASTTGLLTFLLTSRPDNSWQVFMPVIGACLYMLINEDENTNRYKGLIIK